MKCLLCGENSENPIVPIVIKKEDVKSVNFENLKKIAITIKMVM